MNTQAMTGAVAIALIAAMGAAPAHAEKWTISCDAATLAAYDKGASRPYEVLEVKKYVVTVDTDAKTCAFRSVEAVYLKGKSEPVTLAPAPDAKCDLRVTNKGRAFLNARANLKGEKALTSPILTLNYEVRSAPPAAGSAEAKGDYMVISGFPVLKAKGGKYDSRVKAACAQTKAGS
jgi:hypothetical protein